MAEYKNFNIDFAKRTLYNLKYMQNQKKNGEYVFEVTQLINSFLGLIVFPYETYLKNANSKTVFEPEISKELLDEINSNPNKIDTYNYKNDGERKSFKTLAHRLRNAASHRRIQCESVNGIICSIVFEDRNGKCIYRNELSVNQIERLVTEICNSIINQK